MHILIAPNAFKNSLTALEAARAIEKGLMQSNLACTCECFPIADGGDGTAELIIKKFGGNRITKEVRDPLGRIISSSFGLIDEGRTAVIEMADASGMRLLSEEELDPLHATSFGTGELIKLALNEGVSKIIIGLGGSATVDGGVGILKALGARFLNATDEELTGMPESLVDLNKIDLTRLDPRVFDCEITVLCDVDNKLLGSMGAASVFGPQKGASTEGVLKLEASLSKLRDVALKETGRDMVAVKHGGTAGGSAAGLYAFLDGKLVNGADHFLKLTGFEQSLKISDLVITGEGSIDEQTLQGKGPFAVARMAKKSNLPVIGLAGKVPMIKNEAISPYFDVLLAIGNGPADIVTAMQFTSENLIRTSCEMGNLLALTNKINHNCPEKK
jgi:glycerate kinase